MNDNLHLVLHLSSLSKYSAIDRGGLFVSVMRRPFTICKGDLRRVNRLYMFKGGIVFDGCIEVWLYEGWFPNVKM